MAHAHGDEGGYAAVQAGVISIEHGTYFTNRTLQLMKKKLTWLSGLHRWKNNLED